MMAGRSSRFSPHIIGDVSDQRLAPLQRLGLALFNEGHLSIGSF
jgi:hypothetical protein